MRIEAVVLRLHKDGKAYDLTLPIEGRMAWRQDEEAEGIPVEEFLDINFRIQVSEVFMITH